MGALTELVPPDVLQTVLTVMLGSYLLGSIPFGVVLTKAAGLGDIRAIGFASYATPVMSTLLLVFAGKAELGWVLALSCGLIAGGAMLARLSKQN
jgi:hypothetical protein